MSEELARLDNLASAAWDSFRQSKVPHKPDQPECPGDPRFLAAAVAAFLPLAACGGLMDRKPMVAIGCFGGSLVARGWACRHYGLKWKKGSGFHMMYGIPLEIWGWIDIVSGGFFGVLAAVALVKSAVVG